MKYYYAYKTSDGARHEASMDAESREQVFAKLREQGIKAIKVTAADGSKANGEVRGVRKRIVTLIAIVAALSAGVAVFFAQDRMSAVQGALSAARPLPRQEIVGLRSRIDGAGDSLFDNRLEKFLARFAEPGRAYVAPEADWPGKADVAAAMDSPILISEDEFTEHIDLKRIVAGMKKEMSDYLSAGGLISGYIRELINRQESEITTRKQAEKKLEDLMGLRFYSGKTREASDFKAAYNFWLEANARLQSLGIYPLPINAPLREYQRSTGLGGIKAPESR